MRKKINTPLVLLHDERIPKRGNTAYNYFVQERFASGDFKGIAIKDSGSIINNEFKALTAGELKVSRNLPPFLLKHKSKS